MLEGLEIAELSLQEAVNMYGESRWDSEYYKKEFVADYNRIRQYPSKLLSGYSKYIRKGIFDISPEYYQTNGVPLIRTSEIKEPIISFNTTVFLSENINNQFQQTVLKPNDLVFTKIGAYIGDVAILPPTYATYNFSQNVAGVSLMDANDGPHLLAFFLTHFGQNQIKRSAMLSGQGKLELEDIRHYIIPNICDKIKSKIKQVIDLSIKLNAQQRSMMQCATKVLLEELKLCNWQPSEESTAIRTFSFAHAFKRWDAEYYQPKYIELFSQMDEIDLVPLHKIVTIQKSIEPGSDMYENKGVPFVRVSDMSKYGLSEPNIYLDAHVFKDVIRPKKDTILLSKDGSVGIAYKVQEDLDVITSGAILHLSIFNDDFLPDYVTLVLNSIVGQMQAERDAGGSVIQHWKSSEIENVLIPKLDKKIQQEISQQVQESFKLRSESKRLLEVAKKAVEIAIEENEENALKYITENGKSLYDK